jgi:hypothetical protein
MIFGGKTKLNVYVLLGIAIIIFIILYLIYITWLRSTTTFPGIKEIGYFTEEPIDGNLSTSASISTSGFNQMLRNGFTFGFTLYLKTPENNYEGRRHIISLLNNKLSVFDGRSTSQTQDECMNKMINGKLSNTKNVNIPCVYLEKASTLNVLVSLVDGTNRVIEINNIEYNKILPIVIIFGLRHVEVYIEGKLHTTQQMPELINISALQSENANIQHGHCGGFSGYLFNAIIWNDILTPIQVDNYNDASKLLFEKRAKDVIFDVSKGMAVVCG